MAASPYDLAVIRIVFFAFVFTQSLTRVPAQMAELPHELISWPTGIRWLYELLPPQGTTARIGALVMVVASLAALFGWQARVAAAVWCGVGIWVLGIPNLFGKVDHNHHLLWFAALLAASPCSDVLAIDARQRGREVAASVRYGFPIRVWWALIGVIYLFAGLPKLLVNGPSWASPSNLRPLLHAQWSAVEGFDPLVRIDQLPMALWLVGIGTLVFELGFILVVFTRLRLVAVLSGIAFHLSTYLLLDISFTSLVLGYVAFVSWGAAAGLRPPEIIDDGRGRASPDRLATIVGGSLLAGAVLFGATNVVDGWPFASYPAFSGQFSDVREDLDFEIVLDDGTSQRATIDEVFSWVPQSRRGRIAMQFLKLDKTDQRAALADVKFRVPPGTEVRSVRVISILTSTDPDDPRVVRRAEVLDLVVGPVVPR